MNELPPPPEGKSGWPWTEETIPSVGPDLVDKELPRISIVSPSFNQWRYLEECIRSVLLQGYPDIEFIIHDGGSKSEVIEIFEKYNSWISFWVSEPDRGQSHAVNKGILRSTGSIILWMNSDDVVLPEAFTRIAQEFIKDPDVAIVIGQAWIINAKGEQVGDLRSEFSTWENLVTTPNNQIRQVSTFFSRALFDELGLIDENLEIAMDNELLTRFTRIYPPKIIPDYVSAFRSQPDSKSFKQRILGYQEVDRIRKKFLRGDPLLSKYMEKSAKNWLSIARSNTQPYSDRLFCLLSALKLRPGLILTKEFWLSFYRSSGIRYKLER